MKKIKITFTLFVLFVSINKNWAQNKYGTLSFNKAVNVSGKQRMLGQKIAKTYLYIYNFPNDLKAKRVLKTSKIIFEKQNEILAKNALSITTKEHLKGVEKIWGRFKEILEEAPNETNAIKVIKTNTLLLKASNDVVESIINESKVANNSNQDLNKDKLKLKKIINISGKQRMLSQRLALYYFADQGTLKTKGTKMILENVYQELDDAITLLLVSSFNNERIDDALVNAMLEWDEIRTNKSKLLKKGFDKTKIYNMSNTLTIAFNKITSLYEKVEL